MFDPSVLKNKTTAERLFIMIDYRESLNDTLLKGGCPLLNAGNEADDYNQELSENRADSVREYLMKNFAVPEDSLLTRGFGESKPVADNSTDRGRAMNRRVEFKIITADKTIEEVLAEY